MPFITKDRRKDIKDGKIQPVDFQPGDRCYLDYKYLIDEWKKDPRWTTADRLYQHTLRFNFNVEEAASAQLAWQIFFSIYVMPYELGKREENGDVT